MEIKILFYSLWFTHTLAHAHTETGERENKDWGEYLEIEIIKKGRKKKYKSRSCDLSFLKPLLAWQTLDWLPRASPVGNVGLTSPPPPPPSLPPPPPPPPSSPKL